MQKKKKISEEAGIRLGIMRRPVRLLGAKKNAHIIIVPNPPFYDYESFAALTLLSSFPLRGSSYPKDLRFKGFNCGNGSTCRAVLLHLLGLARETRDSVKGAESRY